MSWKRNPLFPLHGRNLWWREYTLRTLRTFGTQKLSDHAILALVDRKACLLENHGMICVEETLEKALNLAVEVEALCEQYWRALQIGKPKKLSKKEMQTVLKKFRTYGQVKKPNHIQ